MDYNDLIKGKEKLSVIGLGYVGLPLAVGFSKKLKVIGFDVNSNKIKKYKAGIDETNEVGNRELSESKVIFCSDEKCLKECRFHVVAVPTPINEDKTPDLRPLINASKTLGRNMEKGSIVTYESTVYPGLTEEICIPILEKESNLKCGKDFFVGYSPERINPGDRVHKLDTIMKIVSAQDEHTLEIVAKVYEIVAKAGVYKAKDIKTAEAAKVIENSQRDINIAFMNELSIIFNKMNIDTKSVLEAARTKWNFLDFKPGLVGGHCIGVDPYYLTYKAEKVGYNSQVILSGRRINDSMGKYIAETTVKKLIQANKKVQEARVGILGFTFKENCPDIRNTKVIDIIKELKEYGIEAMITDPIADKIEAKRIYNINLLEFDKLIELDAIIIALAHTQYKELSLKEINELFKIDSEDRNVLIDVKGLFDSKMINTKKYIYWRL